MSAAGACGLMGNSGAPAGALALSASRLRVSGAMQSGGYTRGLAAAQLARLGHGALGRRQADAWLRSRS